MNKPTIITILTWLLTGVSVPTFAQNTPVCYMQTNSGQIVSLSSLCGSRDQTSSPIESLSAKDREFLENYQRTLGSLKDSPEARESVYSVESQALIRKANEVCKALDAGTFIEFRQNQNQEIAGYSNPKKQRIANFQARTIQTLAPRAYCPGFDG
jgi:hypothetical protein